MDKRIEFFEKCLQAVTAICLAMVGWFLVELYGELRDIQDEVRSLERTHAEDKLLTDRRITVLEVTQ